MPNKKKTGKKIGQILIDLKFIDEHTFLQFLSKQLQIPFIDIKNYAIDMESMRLLPEEDVRRLNAIVLKRDEDGLLVGMADPTDILGFDELQSILQEPIQVVIVSQKDLQRTIDINYRRNLEISDLSHALSVELGKQDYDVAQLAESTSLTDAPVVKLLQSIFEDAAQVNASDVHIEPDEKVLRLRVRIDGVLHEQILQQKQVADALSLRLKLMANLNIAEKRIPQDGRFSIKVKNKKYDVRLSCMPSQYGESVVMRLLNQSNELLSLDQIGIPSETLKALRKVMTSPNGLILITGPTGSGKSTTLYGMLTELNTPRIKIITVEDPVEYRLSRLTQVQVQANIDLTFARALRSILRQDPDIIMIGELRDQETAEIAMRAAMTGHLVLSTLHTRDAISTAERLIDMGVESYLVASVLKAIIAQRLVRKICPNCAKDYELTAQEQAWLTLVPNFSTAHIVFKKGTGCPYCYHTGYKGQIGMFELLVMTNELTHALQKNDIDQFRQLIASKKDFQPLIINALNLATTGITTIEEVMSIFGEIYFDIDADDNHTEASSHANV